MPTFLVPTAAEAFTTIHRSSRVDTYDKNIANDAGTLMQRAGRFLAQVVEVQAHSGQEVLRLSNVHPEPCKNTQHHTMRNTKLSYRMPNMTEHDMGS